jgi:hypothetical protein
MRRPAFHESKMPGPQLPAEGAPIPDIELDDLPALPAVIAIAGGKIPILQSAG